ncbi:MAG: hypothetical protein M1820_002423 [Bogoriella megaspora]|nr:MAG: hypothetical protein M1820_002423 [Bogoriella megaspora]
MKPCRQLLQPKQLTIRIRALRIQPYQRRFASVAAAITPAVPIDQTVHSVPPIARYPPTQPPSYKPPEYRKSQLLRSYASLLRSSPLILLFQHNNIRSVEWMALRREIASALHKLEEARAREAGTEIDVTISSGIKLQILQTSIFATALKIVEFYNPPLPPSTSHPVDPSTASSAPLPNTTADPSNPIHTHTLSTHAHDSVTTKFGPRRSKRHALDPLLSGPICAVTFPRVAPAHLATLLRLLSPSPQFPAPRRREVPSYHEPAVQAAVQKLVLLGARIEGRVLDGEGVAWVGGIQGGMEGLRAQLVGVLQGAQMGLLGALEGAGRSLYAMVEGRRVMLEEDEGKGEGKGESGQQGSDAGEKQP